MNKLIKGNHYKLVTHDMCGNQEPESEWIDVVYAGKHLRDARGETWTEYITMYPEDIRHI